MYPVKLTSNFNSDTMENELSYKSVSNPEEYEMVSAKNKLFSNEIETAFTNVLSPVPKEAYEVVHVCSPTNESKEYITIQWNEYEEERPENPIEIENLPMFTKFFQDSNLEEQAENKREDPDDLHSFN